VVRKAETSDTTWSPNELDGEACACSHLVHVLLLAAASPKSKLLPLEEGVVAVIIAFAPALPIIGTYNESGALSRGERAKASPKQGERSTIKGRESTGNPTHVAEPICPSRVPAALGILLAHLPRLPRALRLHRHSDRPCETWRSARFSGRLIARVLAAQRMRPG
jgi:hypothetical protein